MVLITRNLIMLTPFSAVFKNLNDYVSELDKTNLSPSAKFRLLLEAISSMTGSKV